MNIEMKRHTLKLKLGCSMWCYTKTDTYTHRKNLNFCWWNIYKPGMLKGDKEGGILTKG